MSKKIPIIVKDFPEWNSMQTTTDIMNHAAAQNFAWLAPVMVPGALVSATTCTKIRPVRGTGGPSRGDRT